jgi:hypothetical protein
VRVTVTVTDARHRDAELLRELGRWLGEQEQLRNRTRLVEGRRQPGALSETALSLVADVGGPGLAALATALIAWLRHRTSDTRVVVRRPDGTRFEISARRVRGMGARELHALIDQVSTIAERPPAS